jgi:hypothetical protein
VEASRGKYSNVGNILYFHLSVYPDSLTWGWEGLREWNVIEGRVEVVQSTLYTSMAL